MNTNTHTVSASYSPSARWMPWEIISAPVVNHATIHAAYRTLEQDYMDDCYADYLEDWKRSGSTCPACSKGEYWTNKALRSIQEREMDM